MRLLLHQAGLEVIDREGKPRLHSLAAESPSYRCVVVIADDVEPRLQQINRSPQQSKLAAALVPHFAPMGDAESVDGCGALKRMAGPENMMFDQPRVPPTVDPDAVRPEAGAVAGLDEREAVFAKQRPQIFKRHPGLV